MKQIIPSALTNRELITRYEYTTDKAARYALLQEMTKRLGWKLITPDVVAIFKQYKTNGAGDKFN